MLSLLWTVLFSIRELQININAQKLQSLQNYYGVAIASPEELYETLENLAQSLNCGDENV